MKDKIKKNVKVENVSNQETIKRDNTIDVNDKNAIAVARQFDATQQPYILIGDESQLYNFKRNLKRSV